jgi:chaperonin GroEL
MFTDDGKFLEWARQRTVAADEPSMVEGNVRANNGNFGWNATTGQFGDLLKMPVVDSTSAARNALQNAACIAAMILTDHAMGVESPDEEKKTGRTVPQLDS